MTTRILPASEWSRLAGTELEQAVPHLKPEDTTVLVVEDGDQIVGCWALIRYVHAECVWVHPDHRGRCSVARRLLAFMRRTARGLGASAVITGSLNPEVSELLRKLRATALPGQSYVLPV